MQTTLSPQDQAHIGQASVRYIAGLRKISKATGEIAETLETMLNVEGSPSVELAGFMHTSANSVLRNVPAIITRAMR